MPWFFSSSKWILDFSKKTVKDRYICRQLCSQSLFLESTETRGFNPCEKMCFELTRSYDFAGEVCPFEKYCKRGCPCRFYQCEKIENAQTLVPVWKLTDGQTIDDKPNGLIRKRMERRVEAEFEKFPIIFSTLLAQNSKSMSSSETEKLFQHECF